MRLEALKNLKLVYSSVGVEKLGVWIIKLKKKVAMSDEMKKDC